jgi:hypothetical protein
MIILISISIAFILGFILAYYKMPLLLDFIIEKSEKRGFFNGSWKTHLGVGRAETNFIEKAAIARIGLGANNSDETVYWNAFYDSNGEELNTKYDYRIEIEKQIDVLFEQKGFWSITAYGANQLLMENEAYQYVVRSEDVEHADLPLTIYLSSNKSSAKLYIPLSKKEQKFSLALRCYRPDDKMKKHDSCKELELPKIVRI